MRGKIVKSGYFFIVGLAFILSSCNTASQGDEVAQIKQILAMERTAHLTKNDSLMTSAFADTVIQVNRGIVAFVPLQEARAKFSNYFHSADIIKWDDVAEPIIRFSADKKTAFVIVQKQVIIKDAGSRSNVYDTTDFAWMSVFQKANSK